MGLGWWCDKGYIWVKALSVANVPSLLASQVTEDELDADYLLYTRKFFRR